MHQTNILAEGFRSLREGETVEFDVEVGQDGRNKVRESGICAARTDPPPSRRPSEGAARQLLAPRAPRRDATAAGRA